MAGRKHHFIQQHLLRGFAIDPNRRPAHIWVYRKNSKPFTCATDKYGAQRDFYGTKDDTSVDDIITSAEHTRFDNFVDIIRDCPSGSVIDPVEASRFYQHLLFRTNNLRGVFREMLTHALLEMTTELFNGDLFVDHMVELIKRHPKILTKKIPPSLHEHQKQIIIEYFKSHGEKMARYFAELAKPELIKGSKMLLNNMTKLVADAHINALKKEFLNENGIREVAFRCLNWHIFETSSPLILGDSCAFSENGHGYFQPFPDTVKMLNLYVPISKFRYLCGSRENIFIQPNVNILNCAAVTCSFESFCSSTEEPDASKLISDIGKTAMPVKTEEIRNIAIESLYKILEAQLINGLSNN